MILQHYLRENFINIPWKKTGFCPWEEKVYQWHHLWKNSVRWAWERVGTWRNTTVLLTSMAHYPHSYRHALRTNRHFRQKWVDKGFPMAKFIILITVEWACFHDLWELIQYKEIVRESVIHWYTFGMEYNLETSSIE